MAKPALSYLPETSDEAKKANLAYQEALSRLTQTLDARKNQTFDPVMMAMAAGFLGPTQTGSFGEALGRAAGLVGKAQEAQYGQDIESAKAGMELAQSGLQLQRQRGLDQATRQWLQGRGGNRTTTLMQPGGAKPEGQPSGGLPSGQAAAPSGGLQVMDPDPTWTTQEEYVATNQNSGKSLGELLADYQEKFGKHRFIKGDSGNLIDRQTGMLVPTTTGPNVTRQIIGLEDLGQVEMSQYNAMRLDEALRNGNPTEYYKIAEEITGRTGLAPKTVAEKPAGSPAGAPPSTDEPPPITRKPGASAEGAPSGRAPGIRSKADIAAEEAATTEAARERAKSLETQRTELMQRGGNTARNSIATANKLTKFASFGDAKQMFGLASTGILPNFLELLQAGVGVPGGSINIAGVMDFYRNLKLDDDQLERYRAALQEMRMMSLAMSEVLKGSVSNYEQGLMGEASINEKDLPGTILLKAEALRARAQFDKDVAELARKNPKLNVEQLKDLEGYQLAEGKLNERYRNLILKKPEFFKDPAFVDAAKQNKPELISYDRPLPGSQSKGTSLYDAFKQKSSKPK